MPSALLYDVLIPVQFKEDDSPKLLIDVHRAVQISIRHRDKIHEEGERVRTSGARARLSFGTRSRFGRGSIAKAVRVQKRDLLFWGRNGKSSAQSAQTLPSPERRKSFAVRWNRDVFLSECCRLWPPPLPLPPLAPCCVRGTRIVRAEGKRRRQQGRNCGKQGCCG